MCTGGRFRLVPFLCGLFLLLIATGSPAQQSNPANPQVPVVRVTTRLVVVDVVVTDKQGKPVAGLSRDDFTVLEHGQAQAISIFRFEQPEVAANAAPAPPPLPLHVYTNRPDYRRPAGPPTFLLLDGLNTSEGDQVASREQLLAYLATQLQPGQRVAVLALSEHLELLQDFTSDPAMLRAALSKFTPKKSAQMAQGEPRTLTPMEAASMTAAMIASLDRFNKMQFVDSVQDRVKMTIAALNAISRIAAGFPGRKNLIWVSAGFPLAFLPGQTGTSSPPPNFSEDVRRATAMLNDAQVAVYPVDARGLIATSDTRGINDQMVETIREPAAADGGQFDHSHALANVSASNVAMEEMAADTGGLAITNHNDLSHALALTLADGATYYSLGYYPADSAPDGQFRRIEVKVSRKGLKLRYRRGYYGSGVAQGAAGDTRATNEILAALNDPLPDTAVTFRAYVPTPAPAARAAVEIQFLVDLSTVSCQPLDAGGQGCELEFVAAAFTPGGKLLTTAGQTAKAQLKAEEFAKMREGGLPFRMKMDLEPGNYQLRLAVRDDRSGWIGTLDLPIVLSQP